MRHTSTRTSSEGGEGGIEHCGLQLSGGNRIVTGSGSTNPLRYCGIVQSTEKFADLSQRFTSRLPDHPHGYIPGVQAPFAARNQTLSIHTVFFGYSLQYSVRLNGCCRFA